MTNIKNNGFLKRARRNLPIVFFPVLMILILGPIEVYSGNITDFEFMLEDFIWLFLGVAVLVLVAGTLFLVLLPEKVCRFLSRLLFVFSLMAYLQYLFLNRKLAMGDGTAMDWRALHKESVINMILWIVFLIGIYCGIHFLIKKFGDKILWGSSLAIDLILFVAVSGCLFSITSSGKMISHYQLNGRNQMKVAGGENIIVLSLDSTERELFESLAKSDPSFCEGLEDFTYYNQYDSLYLYTFPSLIHLLTGQNPDTEVNRMEYMKNAWTSDTSDLFYRTLHENNFVCNVFTDGQSYVFGNVEYMKDKFDNLENADRITDAKLMFPMMLKYSLYVYVPYLLKPLFEVDPNHFRGAAYYEDAISYLNRAYYDRLIREGLSVEETWENAFIFEHIQGVHNPMDIGKDAQPKENAAEEETMYGAFHICKEYMSQLKELGLYEDATIIILSDHGHSLDKGPVFMIKQKGEHHDTMQFCGAPITSDDFLATIFTVIGEDTSALGTSIFEWEEGQRRERIRLETCDGFRGYTYYESESEILEKEDYDVIQYRKDW